MGQKRALGKGIDILFTDNEKESNDAPSLLRLSEIEPEAKQPRTIFNHEPLEELASSIAAHGLIQPIIVRPGNNGYYKIIAGERRWRASKMAGLTEVPVIILDVDDRKAAELSLIENLQREDLNAIEEAAAYKALINDYALTQEEVSNRIGKSRSAVANSMRLLELPDSVSELVKNNDLSAGHARALLGLNNKSLIEDTAKKVAQKGISVRMTEELVRTINKKNSAKVKEETPEEFRIDYVLELEKRVTSQLGRKFKIHQTGKRKKIELEFNDNSDLEAIIKHLCGNDFFED